MSYSAFLAGKRIIHIPTGFEPGATSPVLFDFQSDVVRWACRRGRAALFEDCGLGKTLQQLSWADQVLSNTKRGAARAIILAPLCVAEQTVKEGKKIGVAVRHIKDRSEVSSAGIYITNYEKLHRINVTDFDCIVLDESSILKAYDGATRTAIIKSADTLAYRLACTATPAPNDYMELGNHAEFLSAMSRSEMLATFFTHDGGETSKWRLKGHAESDFWRWLCSWAVHIRKPSDLGYTDGKFILPELEIFEHAVAANHGMDGFLFAMRRRKATGDAGFSNKLVGAWSGTPECGQ